MNVDRADNVYYYSHDFHFQRSKFCP